MDTTSNNLRSTVDANSECTEEPGSYDHLDARARHMVLRPIAERIKGISAGSVVTYPILGTILNETEWLIREPTGFRARGLVVYGPPGNGKTAIAEILKHRYPLTPHAVAAGSRPPDCAIAIDLSGLRTTKGVLLQILDSLGSPIGKGSVAEQELRVHDILRRCGCRLLILDELQDMLNSAVAEQHRVIEVVKHIMNKLRLPVLALGTEEAADAFRSDPHMAARFKRIELSLWEGDDVLSGFLREYEKSIPLKRRSNLDNPLIRKHLVSVGGGVLDLMLLRIKAAAQQAIVDGTERITLELLKTAPDRQPISVLSNPSVPAQAPQS